MWLWLIRFLFFLFFLHKFSLYHFHEQNWIDDLVFTLMMLVPRICISETNWTDIDFISEIYSVRKNANDLKACLENVVIPMFCSAEMSKFELRNERIYWKTNIINSATRKLQNTLGIITLLKLPVRGVHECWNSFSAKV